ncbi:replication-relaxation family protein [Priestia aryabhattai]|jgi:Replication-relaxation|uniref:replication-relaxation family protein n=1 Tax=Priestia aryabhattai TaxID=412384 RepID=UPI002E205967|nr:replication-relaxation family protein [Priestia aryabhattai]
MLYDFKKLTEREKEVLVWIARHTFVTANQVEKMFGVSRRIAYRILKKLKDYEYLNNELLVRKLGVYYATKEGMEVAGIDMNPTSKVSNLAEVRHELMIVDLEVFLTLQDKKENVESEWLTSKEIKKEKYRNADKIPGVNSGTLVKGVKDELPDAYWIKAGHKAAMEVELSRKDKKRIEKKLKIYDSEISNGNIAAVMYYTDLEGIKNLIESQRGVMKNHSRLIVRDFPEIKEGE